jgi:hypothetical protein
MRENLDPAVAETAGAAAGFTSRPMSAQSDIARKVYQRIAENIAKVMKGQAEATRKLLAALASGGHVLLDDFPRVQPA